MRLAHAPVLLWERVSRRPGSYYPLRGRLAGLDGGGPIEGDIGGLRSRRLGPDVAASPSQAVFNAT